MLQRLRNWFSPDLALDLGTANTLIGMRNRGIILNEPSVVALHQGTRKILGRGAAVGKLARQMMGRTPDSIHSICPLRHGVISDYELCEAMLRYFLRKVSATSRTFRPRVLIAVPGDLSHVERRAVFNSVERAGAGRIYLIGQAKAAAIGAGLPISEPLANMICDIGSGTTEIAILSMAETVANKSLRLAGDAFDQAIVDYLREQFSLRIGLQTAERLKIEIGSAWPLEQELTREVGGLDTAGGVPRKAMITSEEIRAALKRPLKSVLDGIKQTIELCQPELISDLADTGLVLSGGSALLRGIDLLFNEQLGIPVRIARDPLATVARGTMICVEHLNQWRESLEHELVAA